MLRRREDAQHSLEAKQRSLAEKRQLLERLDKEIKDLSMDLGSPELGKLAPEEQQERQRLQPAIKRLQVLLHRRSSACSLLPGHDNLGLAGEKKNLLEWSLNESETSGLTSLPRLFA